jgi:Protein of unknown function (DUF4013)
MERARRCIVAFRAWEALAPRSERHSLKGSAMKYVHAYRYLFESPNWLMNLLATSICQLVPILGRMVLMGYTFEIIEALHRKRDARYPDFDTNRLIDYLKRGVWPFIVELIVGVLLTPIIMLLYSCVFAGIFITPEKGRGAVAFLLLAVFYLAIFVVSVLIVLVLLPLSLRAGLTQDFGQTFSMPFVKDFIKRVWLEMILQQLFLLATSFVLAMAGLALFCVGVYAAAGLIAFAQYHLLYQLYELYLERGGTPIPTKTEPGAPPTTDIPTAAPPDPEGLKPAEET